MKKNTKKTIRFFLKHVKRYKGLTSAMFLSISMAVILHMIFPFLYKQFFNTLVEGGTKEVIVRQLLLIILYIFLLDVGSQIFWRISAFLNNRFQPKVMANILNECFQYLHKHSYNFFNNNFTGALVKKVNRLARSFEAVADRIYWDTYQLLLRILIVFGVLMYLHPLLGGLILFWTITFITVSYFIAKYKLKFELKRAKADTKVTASLADTITNSTNIKLFSGRLYEGKKFKNVTKRWEKRTKKAWDVDTVIEGIQGFLMTILEILILYIAVILWKKDVLTIGDFALIQAYLIEIFVHIWGLGRIIRSLYQYFADAEEMIVILNTPYEIKNKKNAKNIEVHHGKVEFQNVSFSYEKDKDVLENLSFKVKPSQKIALIGPSGGGKTTIIKLMLRLFDIPKGKILIDDQDISKVTQDSLRGQIGLVPQDPILFHRTLMENIRYGRRNASDKEVIAAAKLAHCHEFIKKFPKGYATYVGERGVKLSGGERQRVAIARAILSNTKILILDEATSQLDSESEKLIQKALENLMKNKTTFIIAHRLSTIMQMDKVFVLKDGKIVEEGDHTSLVNKKGSLYKRLWDLQVGGYLSA